MSRSTAMTLLLATAAFLTPLGLTLYQNRATLLQPSELDPTRGEMLFFTSPR